MRVEQGMAYVFFPKGDPDARTSTVSSLFRLNFISLEHIIVTAMPCRLRECSSESQLHWIAIAVARRHADRQWDFPLQSQVEPPTSVHWRPLTGLGQSV